MLNKKNDKITNGHKQMTSFLIEELKENWAYIRHDKLNTNSTEHLAPVGSVF